MKLFYQKPEMNLLSLGADDVITTSFGIDPGKNDMIWGEGA